MGRVVANIDENVLKFVEGTADRLVYSVQFIGRDLPALASYQKQAYDSIRRNLIDRLELAGNVRRALKGVDDVRTKRARAASTLERLRRTNSLVGTLEEADIDTG